MIIQIFRVLNLIWLNINCVIEPWTALCMYSKTSLKDCIEIKTTQLKMTTYSQFSSCTIFLNLITRPPFTNFLQSHWWFYFLRFLLYCINQVLCDHAVCFCRVNLDIRHTEGQTDWLTEELKSYVMSGDWQRDRGLMGLFGRGAGKGKHTQLWTLAKSLDSDGLYLSHSQCSSTYLTGSIEALRFTYLGPSFCLSFFSQPTHFGHAVEGEQKFVEWM